MFLGKLSLICVITYGLCPFCVCPRQPDMVRVIYLGFLGMGFDWLRVWGFQFRKNRICIDRLHKITAGCMLGACWSGCLAQYILEQSLSILITFVGDLNFTADFHDWSSTRIWTGISCWAAIISTPDWWDLKRFYCPPCSIDWSPPDQQGHWIKFIDWLVSLFPQM